MRAIIRCETTIELERLDAVLSDTHWWPSVDQEDDIVQKKKEEIVAHISDQDRALAEKTYRYTIYDDMTKTWGIVSNPASNVLTFRLKNPVSERLKSACEKLVADLRSASGNPRDGKSRSFRFVPHIEVLEPNSEDHAFFGEILPPKRLSLAIRERKTEFYVGLFTGLMALLLLIMTSPLASAFVLSKVGEAWRPWTIGTLERFSTAALVTMTISWFEVLLHWFDMQRQSIVRWLLE